MCCSPVLPSSLSSSWSFTKARGLSEAPAKRVRRVKREDRGAVGLRRAFRYARAKVVKFEAWCWEVVAPRQQLRAAMPMRARKTVATVWRRHVWAKRQPGGMVYELRTLFGTNMLNWSSLAHECRVGAWGMRLCTVNVILRAHASRHWRSLALIANRPGTKLGSSPGSTTSFYIILIFDHQRGVQRRGSLPSLALQHRRAQLTGMSFAGSACKVSSTLVFSFVRFSKPRSW